MSTSAETVSFYCHTCGARFSLPAPPSPFHLTLCPRCRRDYLDDSPTPQPVLPPPPPPCAVPWQTRSTTSSAPSPPPPIPFSSSSPPSSTTTLTSRSSTAAELETMSASQDLLPPPLPPWLLQASASHDPWNYLFNPPDCPPPPPPIPRFSLSPSSSTSTLPRTLVSPCTRPSSSSTRPPPTARPDSWDSFFGSPDPVVATGEGGPPLNMSMSARQVCREFRVLCSQQDQRRSSPAVSRQSSAYFSACSSPLLASPPPHHQHQGEPQPGSSSLSLSSSTAAENTPTSRDPSPPPPPESPVPAWDIFGLFDSDFQSPPRPPPRPPVSAFDATFDTPPLQRGGSQAAPAESIAALPTITVTVTDPALVCAVCTDLLLPSAPARRLPCGHMYHSDCIVTWLSLRNSCPVCRGSIPTFHSPATEIASSPPSPVPAYDATFETRLQLLGPRASPPPVSAYDATFDTPPLQRGGSQAAPAESIVALPTITVTVTDPALVCAVCTDLLLPSAPARRLPCSHLYHSDCIVTWLSLRNSCPVCRGSIPTFHGHSPATDIASSPPSSLPAYGATFETSLQVRRPRAVPDRRRSPTFHSPATDIASSPSRHPTPDRRRSLPGGRRIRRICSRLLRRMEISRDRQTNSSRDRQTDSSGNVHV